jgi:hypothetical protein
VTARRAYGRLGSDEELVRMVWSLGAVTCRQLARATGCVREQVHRRLGRLRAAGVIAARRHGGSGLVFSLGPRVARFDPALALAWQPPAQQLSHTLLTVDVLLALAARPLPRITSWAGEPELRAWLSVGEPRPDAALEWEHADATGRVLLETDRATEPHRIWAAKLRGYRDIGPGEAVLAAAPSADRARRIAAAAAACGVPLLAVVTADLLAADAADPALPLCFDAAARRRRPLGPAFLGC